MNAVTKFFSNHGKHILTLTFVAGFAIDFVTLPEISNPLYPYIGLVYISLVGLFILLREWQMHRLSIGKGSHKVMNLFGILGAFVLGSLLSYIFIYYLRSSDVFTSWPLYLFLIFCALLNEFSFQSSTRLLINTGLLYISIVFFTVFNLPLVLKEVSDPVFLKSIILSFLICFLFSSILSLAVYNKSLAKKVYALCLLVPALVGGLYFLNITPAVPLTLRDAGVFAKVTKNQDGNYTFSNVKQVRQTLLGFSYEDYVFVNSGEPLYFYAAVLAPAKVTSSISHVWQKKNEVTGIWETKQNVSFPIVGGRKQGYRGYTLLTNSEKGEWRVLVQVGGKRVVGQKTFIIE